jgi:hypothetical protein
METKKSFFEDLLAKLREPYEDLYFDNALMAIFKILRDKPERGHGIISFLSEDKVRDPIDFSSLFMTLLATNSREHMDWLYTYFVFFQDNFPQDNHFLGPYYAMMSLLSSD